MRNIEDYNYTFEIDLRVGDFDVFKHINNTIYANFIELARIKYLEEVLGIKWFDHEKAILVIKNEFEFLNPIRIQEKKICIAVSVKKIKNSSFEMEFGIFNENQILSCLAKSLLMFYNHETAEKVIISRDWRNKFSNFENCNFGTTYN